MRPAYRTERRFSDPQIAIAGRGDADPANTWVDFAHAGVSFGGQIRARVAGRDKGSSRVWSECDTGVLPVSEMIGRAAEDTGHLRAWSIESRLTVTETLQRPFCHPVLKEGHGTAVAEPDTGLITPLRCIDSGPGG
ncbi:hypothetical protein [uncultured Roseobacter sp.]|uniref:hypothetical protein n=1 Tax=uncultured Roseobacter sp. TaxID=114847 RepID=UPI002602B0D7|nr:hypothetical protein [uncultured Roseobacter sp.]